MLDLLFFCERAVNVWNSLPARVDFNTLTRTIKQLNLYKFLRCFNLVFNVEYARVKSSVFSVVLKVPSTSSSGVYSRFQLAVYINFDFSTS